MTTTTMIMQGNADEVVIIIVVVVIIITFLIHFGSNTCCEFRVCATELHFHQVRVQAAMPGY